MVLGIRSLEGVKDAVVPLYATVPGTDVAPCFKVKLVAVKVNGSIGTLKVAVTTLLNTMPEALFAGSTEVTEGDVPIVNLHT